jgi:hypothetical protein
MDEPLRFFNKLILRQERGAGTATGERNGTTGKGTSQHVRLTTGTSFGTGTGMSTRSSAKGGTSPLHTTHPLS